MAAGDAGHRSRGTDLFASLGRGIVRHPWYPIIAWLVLLVLAVPLLSHLGSVTTNSATALPDTAPSAVAAREIAQLFPNASGGSDSLILVTGSDVTGPTAQRTIQAIGSGILGDPNITYLDGVSDLYSSYAAYLTGSAELALQAIATAYAGPDPINVSLNQTAALFWTPPAVFLSNWQSLVIGHPNTSAAQWNWVAYNQTLALLAGDAEATQLLDAFYFGPLGVPAPAPSGFNGSADCAADPSAVVGCTDAVARATLAPLVPQLIPDAAGRSVALAALDLLSTTNYTDPSAQHAAVVAFIASSSGVSLAWLTTVGQEFPNGSTPVLVALWADAIVANGSLATYPLPVPPGLLGQFVDATGTGALLFVNFNVSDSYTTSAGTNPVFNDLGEIDRVIARVQLGSDPAHTLTIVQTGGAPLDHTEQTVLDSSLAILLPLTVVVLVVITMLYFRSPITPAITFGALGIALVLGLAGVVVIGTFITHVDSTALTLQNTFVLGVGTDYSIFLVARYREELSNGADPRAAVVTTVTWAGQSIATSGATAILATLALAFSGVALLSQWGFVLSLAVLIAVLVSLTLVPAMLVLVGPRVLWPLTGARFDRYARQRRAKQERMDTYFFRVGRRVRRRPRTVVGLVALASVPLLFVALTAPIAYDFFGQLPSGHPSTDGLAALGQHFGPGRAFPIIALVTFASPFFAPGAVNGSGTTGPPAGPSNGTEFADLALLTEQLNTTSGVASVASPTSASGAPLSEWLAYASLPPAEQTSLSATFASFIGSDHRTVWITVLPVVGGLSADAVALLGTLRHEVGDFASSHPSVTGWAFGGGAAETSDIQQQTSLATERMAIAVSIGLILVLLVVLRSWIIPPMAVLTIGLSIGWAWGITNLVEGAVFGIPLFYFVPTVLFILILGLGIDYNIFLLTRVREERLRGRGADDATLHGLANTGGIITAAAIILASAFAVLASGDFLLLKSIGFSVAIAILLDAMIVRTYLVPASLFLLGDRVWRFPGRRPARPKSP